MILDLVLQISNYILSCIMNLFPSSEVPFLMEVINFFTSIMQLGLPIINFFIPLSTISTAFDVWFAFFTIRFLYDGFMWLLAKFPFLGIK